MFRFDAPGCCRLSLRNLLFGIHVAMWLLCSMLLTADTRSFKDSLSWLWPLWGRLKTKYISRCAFLYHLCLAFSAPQKVIAVPKKLSRQRT